MALPRKSGRGMSTLRSIISSWRCVSVASALNFDIWIRCSQKVALQWRCSAPERASGAVICLQQVLEFLTCACTTRSENYRSVLSRVRY